MRIKVIVDDASPHRAFCCVYGRSRHLSPRVKRVESCLEVKDEMVDVTKKVLNYPYQSWIKCGRHLLKVLEKKIRFLLKAPYVRSVLFCYPLGLSIEVVDNI